MPKQKPLDNSYSDVPLTQEGWRRYTIRSPSGRTITIDAPDEATALRGAQEWEAANAQPKAQSKLAEIRAQYPQYNDMSDEQLGQALHRKFYSDMPYGEFAQRVGLEAKSAEPDGPILEIGGRRVQVDKGFLSMSLEDQNRTVDEIAAQLGIPPEVQQESNAAAKANRLPQPSLGRTSGLAARAIGRGVVADTLGAPADIREAVDFFGTSGINLLTKALNATAVPATQRVLNATGANVEVPDIPPVPYGQISRSMQALPGFSSQLGSDDIAALAEAAGKEAGIELPEPETSGERLFSNVLRYGSGALTGSAGMTKLASGLAAKEAPALLRPYAQAGKKMLVGDTAAGVGTGTALHVLDENAPELGESPLVRLLVALGGGFTGSGATSLLRAPQKIAEAGVNKLPASEISSDPVTGLRPSNKDANLAARFIQEKASDPNLAAENIARNQDFFREAGGAMPTTGLMSDDEGLKLLDKAQRNLDPKPFVESDKAVRSSAFDDLQTLRPEGGDPLVTRALAKGEVVNRRAKADRDLDMAKADLEQQQAAERTLNERYAAFGGQATGASEALDDLIVNQTLRPMQGQRSELRRAIDPEGTTYVPMLRMLDEIEQITRQGERLGPNAQARVVPGDVIEDIRAIMGRNGEGALQHDIPTAPFGTLEAMRPLLAERISAARSNKEFGRADNIRRIRGTINQMADDLAESGEFGEAGVRARAARDFDRGPFAPFMRGEGQRLREAINADDIHRSRIRPSETAGRFLKPGDGGRELARDLRDILEQSPNPQAGQAAARQYVLADLAKVIDGAGKVSETRLQQWINNRAGMLAEFPALQDEVTGLLRQVRSHAATGNRLKDELERTARSTARTQKDIDKSALALVADSDPQNAVRGVLNAKDPVAAAQEIESLVRGNAAAKRGWKAAVADFLMDSVRNAGKQGVPDEADIVSLAKLTQAFRQHEPVLKVVFGDDMRFLYQARRRLELLSNKATQAGHGSPTIENFGLVAQLKNPVEVVLRLMYGALEGGSRVRKLKLLGQQLPDGAARANELVKRAMFDPEVAKHLLTRDVPEAGLPIWSRKLNQLMGWAEAGREVGRRPFPESFQGTESR